MRIGICGAQSVGKTTLMNALRSEPDLFVFTFRNELTRLVGRAGFPINEQGNDLTQRQIVLEHFFNLLMFDNMITDRTLIDACVYTESLFNSGMVTQQTYDMVSDALRRNSSMYDVIFFIEPEFNIEDDGERSTSLQWQQEINLLFKQTLVRYNIPHIRLSGSVVQRVDQALTVIKKGQKNG